MNQDLPQFDDALPERLQNFTAESGDGAVIRLQTGETELSPFIVKLSRDETALTTHYPLPTTDPIAALAQSLIIEHDDVLDDVPLVLTGRAEEDDLLLSIADLKAQLLEDEQRALPMIAGLVTKLDRSQNYDQAVPVETWANVPTVDVLAELGAIDQAPISLIDLESEQETELEPEVHLVTVATWHRHVAHGWQRALASFVGLSLAIVLPLQAMQVLANAQTDGGVVEAESKAALNTFLRGATSLSGESFGTAGEDFAAAAAGFAEAESSLQDLNAGVMLLASVMPQTDQTVESVRALVTAGRELSETAALMSTAAADLSDQKSLNLTTKLDLLGTYIENALPHAEIAASALQKVDPSAVPADYAASVIELQDRTPQLVASMREYVSFVDALSTILGGEDKMRYLALFQNNTELRATGGFVGSFAEMDVEHGEITRLFVPSGGSYDVQGQLQVFVAAPGPLQLLKARWEFQDANWFPDFPSSAKKLRWFYAEAGGPTSDGVVAVNATFVAELLGLLGPVEMPEYGRTFDAENFIFETQKIVELEYDKTENAPKEIIGDLAPILLERMKTADVKTLLSVVDLLARGLEEKDIILNFRDDDLQSTIETLGWSGSIKQTSGDYLMVVNTNLGGGKTDGVIDQDVQVDVQVADDGSIENTVTITKTHRGMKNALFTGNNNVDYLRLYVPQGSVLLDASGFEVPADELFETPEVPLSVDEDLALHMQDIAKHEPTGTDIWNEDGKTVFGNWMQTASGETEIVTFTYKLPFSLFDDHSNPAWLTQVKAILGFEVRDDYTMFIQKQPGVQTRNTHIQVDLPTYMFPVWSSAASLETSLTATNDSDTFAAWLLEQR